MSGTFFGFNTALRGLFAQQKGINTTAHNIANANTPGYTRQQAIMETTPAFPVPSLNRPGGAGQIGTGVDVAEIRRVRDLFLDRQIRAELQSLGKYQEEWKYLGQIETIFMEPGETGLSKVMDEFWSAWNELSKNAENSPIRTTVKETAITLAENFNHLARQMDTVYNDLDQVREIKVDEANAILNKIASLNEQIQNIFTAGDQPNDLFDQRDMLLDDLSKIMDFDYNPVFVDLSGDGNLTDTGMIEITINVVDPSDSTQVIKAELINTNNLVQEMEFDSASQKLSLKSDGKEVVVSNGELKGLANLVQNLDKYKDELDKLAYNIAKELNSLHKTGYDLNGDVGLNFFIFDGLSGLNPNNYAGCASKIKLNDIIAGNSSKIAASANEPTEPDNEIKGDGGIALAIYQISRNPIEGLDKSTIGNYYKNLISSVGVTANAAKTNEYNQQAVVDQLEARKESASGVSVDEEMANMMMYQRSYEAAAKIITTLDEMLQTVLGLKR